MRAEDRARDENPGDLFGVTWPHFGGAFLLGRAGAQLYPVRKARGPKGLTTGHKLTAMLHRFAALPLFRFFLCDTGYKQCPDRDSIKYRQIGCVRRPGEMTDRQTKIEKNLEYFLRVLPNLSAHRGKYAVLRQQRIVGFYDTVTDALQAANSQFHGRLFSVRQVIDVATALGFYSHAVPVGQSQ